MATATITLFVALGRPCETETTPGDGAIPPEAPSPPEDPELPGDDIPELPGPALPA